MTETEELFIYLNSARPFKLKCYIEGEKDIFTLDSIYDNTLSFVTDDKKGELCINYKNNQVKPYLRTIESLSEKELKELDNLRDKNIEVLRYYDAHSGYYKCTLPNYKQVDWLNKNHIDYRGFIERGMAIEVTNKNNPYDKK